MMLITPEYLAVLRASHAGPRGPWGRSGGKWVDTFLPFFDKMKCKDILDYGSGAESVRRNLEVTRPGTVVYCYDPGVPGREALPKPADFVVCTDVFEHVEEPCVSAVLEHVYQLTLRACFLNIALSKAKRTLPDGRNRHITIRPCEWWLANINQSNWGRVRTDVRKKQLIVWATK